MAKRGDDRREKILAVAESIILKRGFAATSIDDILQSAHITKGGFFYHFPGKSDLAIALVERYLEADEDFFESLLQRARELSEDPLQQMLIFLNLMAEAMENLEDVHPGCLVATFTYESQLIDDSLRNRIAQGTLNWRHKFKNQLEQISDSYRPAIEVNLDELADMLSSVLEGGILLSRIFENKITLVQQIKQYRNYLRLLYSSSTN